MDCPNCRHPNPPGAKFCNNCGAQLKTGCPNCGEENPPGSRFCNNCGTELTASPAPSKPQQPAPEPAARSNLHSLIPDEFAARLASARARKEMVGERRIVTMLFCDVKGSTAAAANMDPEDWGQIMNEIFEFMIRPIYKYEGTVARLMGDAILAFFGAPVAHEDDPQRAILAALDIIAGFKLQQEKLRAEWGLDMNFRVGINTGLVMVGAVGSDLQMEYTALGDAINLAARMEQTAGAGIIQVAEDTYTLAAPAFEWESLGEIEIKGKDERVRAYRPLRRKTDPGRLRGIAGLDAPMIGRGLELERLLAVMNRLREGSGGIVFITGEAGLGKSRLLRELKIEDQRLKIENQKSGSDENNFQFSIFNSSITWSEAASLSYETARPYALFQRLLRHVYGVREGDSPVEMWEKFVPILERIPPDMTDQGRVFEALFAAGVQTGEAQPEGEGFKRQLFDLVAGLVSSWTERSPQVIVLDDLHWSDPASIDLLVHLFRLAEEHPLLLVCAMRTERTAPAWSAKESAARDYPHRTTEITLAPLTPTDTDALVNHLLLVADLPAELRKRILEKTDGNPFFIEEIVRVLIDNGIVEREDGPNGVRWRTRKDVEQIEIPGSLQSLLTARIDRLEEETRRTLQLAAVIGRSFYYRVLDTISHAAAGVRAELGQHLSRLQRAEMIHESARLPELEYAFRHALTQEAAYNTILVRERREYHRQVGEAVEMLFADRPEEFYSVLAHHFGEARDPRAIRYETLAGDAAFRLYAIPEAASHYRRAISFLTLAEQAGVEVIHLYSRLGRCYELQSEHAAAVTTYEEMAALARKTGDERMELAALVTLGKFFAIPTPLQDAAKAKECSEKGLEIAERLGDREAEARLLWNFLLLNMYSGRMDAGVPFGERSVALARELGMKDQLAHSLQDLALAYMAIGELARCRQTLEEAFALWEKLNNAPMQSENRSNMGNERMMSGFLDEAIAYFEEGFRFADAADNEWGRVNNTAFCSQIYMVRGEIDRALESQSTWLPRSRKIGHPASTFILVIQVWTYSNIGAEEKARSLAEGAVWNAEDFAPFLQFTLAVHAGCLLRAGDLAGATELQESVSAMGRKITILDIDIMIALSEIEFNLYTGKLAEAGERIAEIIALIHRSGARLFLPETLRFKAGLHLAQGRPDLAREILTEAADCAREIDYRILRWRILADLARFAEKAGDQAEADRCREEAAAVARFILDRIGEAALRELFIGLVESEGISIAQGLQSGENGKT